MPTPRDVRAHPRHDLPFEAHCRLTTVTGRESLPGRVINISCSGIRLQTRTALARGTCLMVELSSRSRLFVRVVLTHVIYVEDEGNGVFSLGGEFLDPLSGDEVRLFLS